MSQSGRHGRPQEEMFMQEQTSSGRSETPTVGPLRINKSPANTSPSNQAASGANPRQRPPYPDQYGPPTSPPPTGPLPYPHDRQRRNQTPPTGQGASYSAQDPSQGRYRQDSTTLQHSSPARHATKPLPESPGPEVPEKEDEPSSGPPPQSSQVGASPPQGQHYYPPPGTSSELRIPNASSVNRLASTSSVSTTKAARGSPPPPETPAGDYPPAGGIEARYAAAGIAGPSTLSSLQAHNFAAQQRHNQYSGVQSNQRQQGNPNDSSGNAPNASAQANAGNAASSQPHQAQHESRPSDASELEQDIQRLQVNSSEEPPPAYSSVSQPNQALPPEKRPAGNERPNLSVSPATANAGVTNQAAVQGGESSAQPQTIHQPTPIPQHVYQGNQQQEQQQQPQHPQPTPSPAPSRNSPPPLPEGWLAVYHQDSGHYYYVHKATNATQWEFPKGPQPLNLNDQAPLSPTGSVMSTNPFGSPAASTFGGKPLASPGMIPGRESIATTMTSFASPTAAGFTVPPPSSGVNMYNIAPANGVYFGPYLRYTNMDVENGIWYGSILMVTDANPPTVHIHQTVDLSPSPRQLKANFIYQHQRWMFFRYDIDLRMEEDEARWTYAITSHLGCTRYEFLIAARNERSWRFIGHSGNDFDWNVNANDRQKVGGVGYMWKDIMQKHHEVGGFHAQLGMGNQIYADRIWKELPLLRQWTATQGKENRKNAPWTAAHEDEVTHAYFHYYTSHFDQPNLREAFAQIPHILTLDDHDIFDGFGSYPEHMQFSNMFKNIGRIGIEMYLLFQHHTTLEIRRHVTNDLDLFTITGTGWHFLKYLGPAVVVVGPDCRSERNPYQVMAGPTYQGLFPKIAVLPPHVQHCIWMIPVPVVYPRLDTAEQFAQTVATGKKAVTGTFNALGKITGSVAGIIGAKGVVNEGFTSIKKAVGKSGLMSGYLSPFGEIEGIDELRDQWTHESKDLERTYLIRTLQTIASTKSLRMTFFSGSSNCCGAGLLSDPSISPSYSSHKAMFQIISSAVVNVPPSPYVLRMLHPSHHNTNPAAQNAQANGGNPQGGHATYGKNDRPLYLPQNGHRSRTDGTPTDTKEDMLEIFSQDVTGHARDTKRLMGRRNYVAIVSFDPEAVHEAFSAQGSVAGSVAGSVYNGVSGAAPGKDQMAALNGAASAPGGHNVSLAVDFFVQADAGAGFVSAAGGGAMVPAVGPATVKYGPLTIPRVEHGH